ncbi:histone PARylation factor 1 [Nymphalis io]|uniref:histone PARylation factor 1 n=1 Tax=Inachis io TaxID=171585 RepID=UPI002166D7EE|nr:histone PARylation factor 1 [Nymphalis io]XP_050362637.1 histone PARylation factor 1 [Nymphalis io]
MSEEWQQYIQDSRTQCKYGIKCYQKNPEHHKQYKHPPQLKLKANKKQRNNRFQPYNKIKTAQDESNNTIEDEKIEDINIEIQPSASTIIENVNEDISKCKAVDSDVIVSYYDKDVDRSILKECFLVEMPPDFYKFYECLNKESESIEKLLANVNLQLIGPYELFLNKLPILKDKNMYLIHWRFFYDPPEFQAIIKKKGKSEFHIGYYRDDPKEKPVFLARNDSSADCIITPISENIFGAVYWFLQNEKKTSPFISIACQKMMEKVKNWAEEHKYSLEEFNMKKRLPRIVCRTFHNAGIVVPYNKKTQLGYRKLVESDAKIKKMFKQLAEATSQAEKDKVLSELQPVLTYASIAMDECDFGTGLEAGIALFCSGLKELQTSALKNLEVAYSLLQREEFQKIIQMHMKHRRKGPEMSVLNI